MSYLQSQLLKKLGGVGTCFSFKIEGREAFYSAHPELPTRIIRLKQSHTAEVVSISKEEEMTPRLAAKLRVTEADGMVSDMGGIGLEIQTADCVPLLLNDKPAAVIGAIHCGWRGVSAGIVETAIEKMAKLGSKRETLHATMGPYIHGENYEVGEEVFRAFAHYNLSKTALWPMGDKYRLDLGEAIKDILLRIGLQPEHIEISDACTFGDPKNRFFSYRREGASAGRQYNIVWLL